MSACRHRMLIPGVGIAGLVVLAVLLGWLTPGFLLLPLFMAVFGLALPSGGKAGAAAPAAPVVDDAPIADASPESPLAEVSPAPAPQPWLPRANRAFGPILAGLVIDVVDFATFGPIGLVLGLPLGGLAGYWMGRALGLSTRGARWCALAAGLYCMLPGTEIFPLATLVGAFVRFKTDHSPPAARRRRPRAKTRRAAAPPQGPPMPMAGL